MFTDVKEKNNAKVSRQRHRITDENTRSENISTNRDENIHKFSKTHQTDLTKIRNDSKSSPFLDGVKNNHSISPNLYNQKNIIQMEDYCRKVEKLQRKVRYLYNEKKKKNYENKKMEEELIFLKKSLKANQQFMQLMKQEVSHTHNQNKILLNEKEKLEDLMERGNLGKVVDLAEGVHNEE